MLKKQQLLILSGLLLLAFMACRINPLHDFTTEGGKTEWAIPVMDSKKTFNDIIKDFDKQALLQIAPDGSLTLKYSGDFISRSSFDIFSQFQNAIFPITDSVMPVPFKMPNGADIDFVDVKVGKFNWVLFSPDEQLNVTLSIPQMTRNGVPFTKKAFATRFGVSDSVDLAGWRIDASATDSIFIYHDARRSDGSRVNLKNLGAFAIKNFEFSFVKGFLGYETFDSPRDTIKIDFFENWKRGIVKFSDPRITITLDNSFGFPVKSVTQVADVLSLDGQRLAIKSPLTEGVNVNYPKMNEIGQAKRTTVVLDKNNSNLADIISFNPVAIDYDIDGLTNPDPSVKTVGFMTDSSAFKLQVVLDLPMVGSATTFEVQDTFKVNLTSKDNLNYADFKILTDNGMPIDLSLQGYFISPTGAVIDSLFNNTTLVLKGAPVDNQGLPRSISTQESTVKIEAARLNRLTAANRLVVKYAFSTTNNGSATVKLTASQSVRVRIGVKLGVTKF